MFILIQFSLLIKHANCYGDKLDLREGANIGSLIRDLCLSEFYEDHYLVELYEKKYN